MPPVKPVFAPEGGIERDDDEFRFGEDGTEGPERATGVVGALTGFGTDFTPTVGDGEPESNVCDSNREGDTAVMEGAAAAGGGVVKFGVEFLCIVSCFVVVLLGDFGDGLGEDDTFDD